MPKCGQIVTSTYAVEFVVESAGVADRLAVVVASPKSGVGGRTIRALNSNASSIVLKHQKQKLIYKIRYKKWFQTVTLTKNSSQPNRKKENEVDTRQ